jgi:uncharacterized protein (DUF302 family)
MTEDGLVTIASAFPVGATMDRLAKGAEARGLTVFARIDHGAGAARAGLPLRATQLIIFGNANGGTPLMQERQSAGIDLPLKALAFEDEDGCVWLSYNDPAWIAHRHGLGDKSRAAVTAMSAGLAGLARAAATP